MRARILVVGDRTGLAKALEKRGHTVTSAHGTHEVSYHLDSTGFDATVVADLRDDETGEPLNPGRRIRAAKNNGGEIICLIEADSRAWHDRKWLYDAGAAAVLERDVEADEIGALIESWCRRSAGIPSGKFEFADGQVVLDTRTRQAIVNENVVTLPEYQFSILEGIASERGVYCTRERLAALVGHMLPSLVNLKDEFKQEQALLHSIVETVRVIRTTLAAAGAPALLHTSRARGIRLTVDSLMPALRSNQPVEDIPLAAFVTDATDSDDADDDIDVTATAETVAATEDETVADLTDADLKDYADDTVVAETVVKAPRPRHVTAFGPLPRAYTPQDTPSDAIIALSDRRTYERLQAAVTAPTQPSHPLDAIAHHVAMTWVSPPDGTALDRAFVATEALRNRGVKFSKFSIAWHGDRPAYSGILCRRDDAVMAALEESGMTVRDIAGIRISVRNSIIELYGTMSSVPLLMSRFSALLERTLQEAADECEPICAGRAAAVEFEAVSTMWYRGDGLLKVEVAFAPDKQTTLSDNADRLETLRRFGQPVFDEGDRLRHYKVTVRLTNREDKTSVTSTRNGLVAPLDTDALSEALRYLTPGKHDAAIERLVRQVYDGGALKESVQQLTATTAAPSRPARSIDSRRIDIAVPPDKFSTPIHNLPGFSVGSMDFPQCLPHLGGIIASIAASRAHQLC